MKQRAGHRPSLKNLLRDERGAILIITTVYLPVIVGFLALAVDVSNVYRVQNTLQVTADAAALAGLATWIGAGDKTLACPNAKIYATRNMPPASYGYGNVLKQNTADCSDVVVGFWNANATPPTFSPDAGGTACGITCNAVQVTTRMSAANSNMLQLVFGPMIGWAPKDIAATAVATYGNDPGATPWNVSIIQDVSASFTQEIDKAKAADQALETCVLQNSSSNSKIGISVFGETAKNYQTPLTVSSNNSTLTTAISNINTSGNNPMPQSGGTDIAAGITTGTTQICPGTTCTPGMTTFKPALILVTDGLPNMCNGSSCQVSTAQANAQAAASAAAAKGMDIYVIYFCNDGSATCSSATNTTAANWLKNSIATDPAKFFNTPTASDMAKLMVTGICAPQHKIRLVL